ncbi:MAG: FAD-binding domain-containing protein [Cyanobacteria bacterium P01_H01_bin.15]
MEILWLRRDLRLSDNEIFSAGAGAKRSILPLFIVDPQFFRAQPVSPLKVRFLAESLANLHKNLQERGSRLTILEGDSVELIKTLTETLLDQGQRPRLRRNRDAQTSYGLERDRKIDQYFNERNLQTCWGTNHFLQTTLNLDQWWREYHGFQQCPLLVSPTHLSTPDFDLALPQLTPAEFAQKYGGHITLPSSPFYGGEDQALVTLDSFLTHRFRGYHWRLSRPWEAQQGATSLLSAHLYWGTISSRTIYQYVYSHKTTRPQDKFALKAFCDRLRWFDKFTGRLYFHPEWANCNQYPEFDEIYNLAPLDDERKSLFHAWQNGQTGYPLVDASMRQLNTTGWMSFRMRALCATFLTINCGVSWQYGADYFLAKLIDGSAAINNWQWQAQAGATNPMSESFRIYNPTKNLKDKDPKLRFVYHWVPELRGYPLEDLLTSKPSTQNKYVLPIVDWAKTRRTNGKRLSDLRRRIRDRITVEGGDVYDDAIKAQATVEKYLAVKDEQYAEYQRQQASCTVS